MKIGYWIALALIFISIFIILGVAILYYANNRKLNGLGLAVGILTFIVGFGIYVFMAWRSDVAERLQYEKKSNY